MSYPEIPKFMTQFLETKLSGTDSLWNENKGTNFKTNHWVFHMVAFQSSRTADNIKMSPFETAKKMLDLGHPHRWLKSLSKRKADVELPHRQTRFPQPELSSQSQQHVGTLSKTSQDTRTQGAPGLNFMKWHEKNQNTQHTSQVQRVGEFISCMVYSTNKSARDGPCYPMLQARPHVCKGRALSFVTHTSHIGAKQNLQSQLLSFSLFSFIFWQDLGLGKLTVRSTLSEFQWRE